MPATLIEVIGGRGEKDEHNNGERVVRDGEQVCVDGGESQFVVCESQVGRNWGLRDTEQYSHLEGG